MIISFVSRDSAVNWINDIEKDSIYKGWPASVNEVKTLLQLKILKIFGTKDLTIIIGVLSNF